MRRWFKLGFNPQSFLYEDVGNRYPNLPPSPIYDVYLYHMTRFSALQFINEIYPAVPGRNVLAAYFTDAPGGTYGIVDTGFPTGLSLYRNPLILRNDLLGDGIPLPDSTHTSPLFAIDTHHPVA